MERINILMVSTEYEPITIAEAQEFFAWYKQRYALSNSYWQTLAKLGDTWLIHDNYPHITTVPFSGVASFFYKKDGRIGMMNGVSDGKCRWPDGIYE